MIYYINNIKILLILSISLVFFVSLESDSNSGSASTSNNTLMQPQVVQNMITNSTNIVLVHGGWADGSGWSKVIPILKDAGHKVIAVQLALHSLSDDVETVKRA